MNLTAHRAPVSVWDRRGWNGTRDAVAMSRWLVGVGGGALALQGLRRRSLAGSLLAGVGGSLACWALTGDAGLSAIPDAVRRWRESRRHEDLVQAASADSFPASDAPAWTPTVGTGLRRGR